MNSEIVEKIANAVLYEGYILYPYRASSVKNQQRWNFGTLAPGEFMQTECLVAGTAESVLDVKVRFLQMTAREGKVWNEAIDRAVPSRNLRLGGLHREQLFDFDNDIQGAIEAAAVAVRDGLFRVTVRIANRNPLAEGSRETILLR
ncbi:MAG: hypothetical protein M3Z23_14830, partial [Acidobacteriota bacterium]|nr:hypothetical protein [Acidobacteriota bacterium]